MKIPCAHYRQNGDRLGCAVIADGREPEPDGTIGVCKPATERTPPSQCGKFHQCGHIDDPAPLLTLAPSATPATSHKKRCGHMGSFERDSADQIIMAKCITCTNHSEAVHECAEFKRCTITREAHGVAGCCNGCTRHTDGDEPIDPERIVKIAMPTDPKRPDNAGYHYNCSVIEWQGKTLLASRFGYASSEIWLSELDDAYQVIPGTLRNLNVQHAHAWSGAEDPRFFIHKDRLHLAFTGYDDASGEKGKYSVSMYVARLNDRLYVEDVWMPVYAKRRTWEKSWGFFEHAGQLHCVYDIAQQKNHVILRREGDAMTEVARTPHAISWRDTALRGGASPVKVGGEYYSFFHTFGTNRQGVTTWGLGLYTFAVSPPFQVLRHVPYLLLAPKIEDVQKSNRAIVYPCGAMLRGGKWIISYGVQDKECRIAVFDQADLERRLR